MSSMLSLGYYDKTKYKGELKWYKINYQQLYGVKLDDILINGKSYGFCSKKRNNDDCMVTFDSGSTYASFP